MSRMAPSSSPINHRTELSDAPVSDWISDFDVEENGGRGWLTGLLCGYPVWTTAARYHMGGFESKK